jgi:hypothetical protein
MTYTAHKSIVRTIREGDPDFRIIDGMTVVPRAMLHVLPECPADVKRTIGLAVTNGWLKSVAHIKDYELMLDRLHD